MSELDIIEPAPTVVTFRCERLELTPVTIGELRAFIDVAQPVMPALQLLANLDDAREVALLADVLVDYGEALAAFAAMGTRRSKDWIQGEQSIPAFIALIGKVVEVNVDFFHMAVQRYLRAEANSVGGNGRTASSISSVTATVSPPSAATRSRN